MFNPLENGMQNVSEQMEKANRDFMTRMEDAAAFNRNNMEACMQAANIMASGMKDMSQAVAGTVQCSMETSMNTCKAMMGVKTLRDLVELQSEYMKGLMDAMMSESTKVSEIAVRCTSEAAAPISERMNDMVEKITNHTRNNKAA